MNLTEPRWTLHRRFVVDDDGSSTPEDELEPHNLHGGFWARMRSAASVAWNIASARIAERTRGRPAAIRAFLDSVHGASFARDVQFARARGASLPVAIEDVVEYWMARPVDSDATRRYRIPRGMPFLAGMVEHYGRSAAAQR